MIKQKNYMECGICYDDELKEINCYQCNKCKQTVCLDCLNIHCLEALKTKTIPDCPECKTKIDIHTLIKTGSGCKQAVDKYNLLLTSKSLDRDEIYPCPQPKCSGYGLKIDNKTYCCQNTDCQFMFCGSCRAASHTGACEKPKISYDRKNCRQCPNCLQDIFKEGGCEYVKCVCNTEIHWRCGKATTTNHRCPSCVIKYNDPHADAPYMPGVQYAPVRAPAPRPRPRPPPRINPRQARIRVVDVDNVLRREYLERRPIIPRDRPVIPVQVPVIPRQAPVVPRERPVIRRQAPVVPRRRPVVRPVVRRIGQGRRVLKAWMSIYKYINENLPAGWENYRFKPKNQNYEITFAELVDHHTGGNIIDDLTEKRRIASRIWKDLPETAINQLDQLA